MVLCYGEQIQDNDAGGQGVVDGEKMPTTIAELADEKVAGLNLGGDVRGGLGLARWEIQGGNMRN